MADKEYPTVLSMYEPYDRGGKVFLRKRHDRISPAHREFDECMHKQLTGRHYPGGLAEVEAAFTRASRECHRTHPY